ncbi:MAG: D-alanyl-D-alanine carboxypeptidase/D-alanyl-D-alanine-endopeptidase [Lentimicrobiaceae bacterium]|jgi:D-alanyl-D-alanine carboxypeptidase/D-alanyl-D-alanine-endopeptidase (penicillin-binding protein 4)
MRKLLFCLIISYTLTTVVVQAQVFQKKYQSVEKILTEIKNDSDFKNAGFGFLAIEAQTGQIISSYNPDMALKPASTQKLITTATMLELYGTDYKFETRLEYTGYIDTRTHILHGNIIIKGGGDPTLGSKYFDQTKDKQFLKQWTEAIQNLKIDSIAGAIIADASIYSRDIIPISWSWTNIGNYFGAGACGLSIYDNYYTIIFNTGNTMGAIVKIIKTIPEVPYLSFDNNVVADSVSEDKSNIFGAPYCNMRYLRGELPIGKTSYGVKGSLPDPSYFAAYELDRTLHGKGIKTKDKPSTIRLLEISGKHVSENRTEITTIYSPPVSKIIEQTNIYSVNLFAEHFLAHCGLKLRGNPETESAAKAIIDFWEDKGMDTQGMSQTDGSGLSQYDAVTPRQMVFLLSFMKNQSAHFDAFYNSLPVAGIEGSLNEMFKGSRAEGNLRVKSGTIERVKAYSGYTKSLAGHEIVFSMIVNNFSCTSKEANAKLERLMIALSELKK